MGEKHIDTTFLDEALRFAITAHSGVERRVILNILMT